MVERKNLCQLSAGQKARISGFLEMRNKELHKLIVFGILPGAEIEVIQCKPSYVLRIDNCTLAIDQTMAKIILVD